MNRFICIHGHFYQPPRENPWLEEVEYQDSAYPYHDWNERITAECYAPNTASRILDAEERIVDITNTYAKISFDFGPTLLSWMERHKPDVYEAVLEADRLSMNSFSGHGSAIAQAYNHMIMPLANKRDKYTQLIWGIKDFEKRFKRSPEGMWLPETAVDIETLETLASLEIKFTILSPRQAKSICRIGESGNWHDVSNEKIDTTMGYLCNLPSGRSIYLFFYNGQLAQEVSFGKLLNKGETFAEKLLSAFNGQQDVPPIVHLATDGETFGHHHRFGDMALSYCLHYIESNNLAMVTNYGEYLEKHAPVFEVEIHENTSWSCVHGIERWRDDCGCHSGKDPEWDQSWRRHLRTAMDWLRDKLIPIYENGASKFFKDVWNVRDAYIEVILDRSHENIEGFLNRHAIKGLSKEEMVLALKLLEMQRNAMLMYTSCGWFFDEISGIEGIQIMQYALMAIQYAEELQGTSLGPEYLEFLEKSPSNVYDNAAKAYEMFVTPARSDLLRVGTHYSISSIFEEYYKDTKICCYTARSEVYNKMESGKLKLAIGKAKIISDITWEESTISFAVLHLGDHNINGGARYFKEEELFLAMQEEIESAFEKGSIPEVIRLMDKHFGDNIYSIWHLFKDEQRKILNLILQMTYKGAETSYRQIYESNYTIMNIFHGLHMKLPRPFFAAAEYILNTDMKKIFEEEVLDVEKLKKLISESQKWPINIDKTTISFVASSWVGSIMEKVQKQPENIQLFEELDNTLELLKQLPITLDLWKAQNMYFSIGRKHCDRMREKAENGDNLAKNWVDDFLKLGDYLNVNL